MTRSDMIAMLRDKRRGAPLTFRAMEERCGYAASLICRWENGRSEPGLSHFIDWCESLGFCVQLTPKAS